MGLILWKQLRLSLFIRQRAFVFTGSDLGGKMSFLGTKNVPFRANGLLTSSVVIELFKRKKKREEKEDSPNNKNNRICIITISLLQVNFLLVSSSTMTPLTA